MDEAFYNKDQVGYHLRKILNKHRGPQGIRGSFAALLQFSREPGVEKGFLTVDFGDSEAKPAVHMQSEWMRTILNGNHASSGFQSDTVEGVIYDLIQKWEPKTKIWEPKTQKMGT